ncbi:MAG: serine hydrolase domain-containing protein [Trueperaceae bacterium]
MPDLAAIDAYVEAEMRAARVPGLALAIVHGDGIVHLRAFGVADPSGRPVTPQTPFVIGSLSKSFTALAVMQLVEEGRVDLDAPVRVYLPWFRLADLAASERITVRQLLHHASGIPAGPGLRSLLGDGDVDLAARVAGYADVVPRREPGVAFEYSNANYLVLGALVEAVTGMPYAAVVRERIFDPLGMRHASGDPAAATAAGLATGYRYAFGFPLPADLPFPRDAVPAGFLMASAEDMARYLIAHLGGAPGGGASGDGASGAGAVLGAAGLAELHRPAVTVVEGIDYAMGWEVGRRGGVPTLAHDGATAAFFASAVLRRDEPWGVVVLSNAGGLFAAPAATIAAGVTALIAGGEPDAPPPLGFATFHAVVTVFVLLLSALLVRSIVLLPRWRRRLAERPPVGSGLLFRVVLPTVVDLSWPLVVFVVIPAGAGFSLWPVMLRFQPDLVGWLLVVAAVTFVKGALRPALAWTALRRVAVG